MHLGRLHRSESEKMIAGVAAGIAEYTHTSVTLIRAIFVVLILVTGVMPGLLAYIALAIILPRK